VKKKLAPKKFGAPKNTLSLVITPLFGGSPTTPKNPGGNWAPETPLLFYPPFKPVFRKIFPPHKKQNPKTPGPKILLTLGKNPPGETLAPWKPPLGFSKPPCPKKFLTGMEKWGKTLPRQADPKEPFLPWFQKPH